MTSNSKEYNIAIAYNQGFSTYYVASKVKAKTKFTWLNTDYINAGYNANFDKTFYENYTKIIAVSKESKTSLLKAHGSLKPEIIIVKDIINSINIKEKAIEEENVLNKNKNIINILTVGRLAKAKGLHLAIKACQILIKKNKTIKWYIIGEGSERSKLQNLINSLKLNDNIILMGYKENPYSYMKTCDIYVQTSLFEGLGLTVIEATILNKPIVCTNFPTASSIIKHNETGLICEMTAKSIANSIIKYIDNPTFVKKVTANLQNQVNNDTELSLQKINDLLSQ
ncbi:MAG TPA: glycosyltransferase [Flavobacteriaceae bacterium]|nr:glycosyltransferase [Flavobacteriaceae bacterium]